MAIACWAHSPSSRSRPWWPSASSPAAAAWLESAVLPFVFLVPAWLLVDVVRIAPRRGAARAQATERALRERDEPLREAAAEERRHVARELHDVVAHAVSVMVVQAGAARQVLRSSPERARIAARGRGDRPRGDARAPRLPRGARDDATAVVAPQPGIGELAPLVARMRHAGLPASLEVGGSHARCLPLSTSLPTGSSRRRSPTRFGTPSRAADARPPDVGAATELRVEVLDDGPGRAPWRLRVPGRGIAGMHERTTLVGGRLEAGPRLGGATPCVPGCRSGPSRRDGQVSSG